MVKIIDVPTDDETGILKLVDVENKDIEMKKFFTGSWEYKGQEEFSTEIGTIKYEKGELTDWKEFPIVSA